MLELPAFCTMGAFPTRRLGDLRQLSFSAWWILDATPTVAQFPATAFITDNVGWSLANTGSNEIQFEVGRDSGSYYSVTTDSAVGSSLIHVGVTWDGGFSSGDTIIYVDGSSVAVSTVSGSGNHNLGTALSFVALAGFEAMSIGWMAIWDRVLGAGEIGQLANRWSPLFFPNGLVSYWEMNNQFINVDRVGNEEFFGDPEGVLPVHALVDLQIYEAFQGTEWAAFEGDEAPPAVAFRGLSLLGVGL